MTAQSASAAANQRAAPVTRTDCCIAGGGPAGVMLGFLLARQGIGVVVLEKHGDFLRDFRGDTIHPSTLRILDELGLAGDLLRLPHDEAPLLQAITPQGTVTMANFQSLHTRWPYLVFLPQWDFLNFIVTRARCYPRFHLRMQADVSEIIDEGGVVRGVRYEGPDGQQEVRALVTVAADGRSSTVRQQAGLRPVGTAPPMDVLWFRLSRRPDDPTTTAFRVRAGHMLLFINRNEYWQVAYVIPKGADQQVRAAGLAAFRRSLGDLAPEFAERAGELRDWDQVKLLAVQANRLRRWYRPGLLCIGDAPHAMSPIGGVGINLAVQDAVASANILARTLANPDAPADAITPLLAKVQRRRLFPARVTQAVQVAIQSRIFDPLLDSSRPPQVPMVVKLLNRFPALRLLPAYAVGVGVRPEHVHSPELASPSLRGV
jgi:2-polyprenyl-6-methoxyphenol hydroxylase-like FAD-dependent oxidoreductase